MYLKSGQTIYQIIGKSTIDWAKKFLKSNPSVKVISKPTKAQKGKAKAVTVPPSEDVRKAARSRASQKKFLKKEKPGNERRQRAHERAVARDMRRGDLAEEARAYDESMPDPDKEYIWGSKTPVDPTKWGGFSEQKKGGRVGKKKRSSSSHADGNKFVSSLYD
jgi:hypothetical protein